MFFHVVKVNIHFINVPVYYSLSHLPFYNRTLKCLLFGYQYYLQNRTVTDCLLTFLNAQIAHIEITCNNDLYYVRRPYMYQSSVDCQCYVHHVTRMTRRRSPAALTQDTSFLRGHVTSTRATALRYTVATRGKNWSVYTLYNITDDACKISTTSNLSDYSDCFIPGRSVHLNIILTFWESIQQCWNYCT